MTISEAKKIIEMCADAVKKSDGDDAKIYVNKEYVLQILDMVESGNGGITTIPTYPGTYPGPGNDEINKAYPVWPPTWPQVWYKTDPAGPPDPGPEFEKVPWWVWYKNPLGDFTCDSNSTGSKPKDADVVVTSGEVHVSPKDYENVTLTNREDISPKRTDYIDDFASSSGETGVKRTDYIDDFAPATGIKNGTYRA